MFRPHMDHHHAIFLLLGRPLHSTLRFCAPRRIAVFVIGFFCRILPLCFLSGGYFAVMYNVLLRFLLSSSLRLRAPHVGEPLLTLPVQPLRLAPVPTITDSPHAAGHHFLSETVLPLTYWRGRFSGCCCVLLIDLLFTLLLLRMSVVYCGMGYRAGWVPVSLL
jgi:hypothetical protein